MRTLYAMCICIFVSVAGDAEKETPFESLSARTRRLIAQLENARNSAEACDEQMEKLVEIKDAGWQDLCQVPEQKLKKLKGVYERALLQLNEEMERTSTLEDNFESLKNKLGNIEQTVIDACFSVEKGTALDVGEAIKKCLHDLKTAEKIFEENSAEFQTMINGLPEPEKQFIMDKISDIKGNISLKKNECMNLRLLSEKIANGTMESGKIAEKFGLIEMKMKEFCSLPMSKRDDAARNLLQDLESSLETAENLLKESQKNAEMNLVGGEKLIEELERAMQKGRELCNDLVLMKHENGRFSKAYKDVTDDLSAMENKIILIEDESEDFESFDEIFKCIERKREWISEFEDKIGELNGRLRIVGDVTNQNERDDCQVRIKELKKSCKEGQLAVYKAEMELVERKRDLEALKSDLKRIFEKLKGVVIGEAYGNEHSKLLESFDLNQKAKEEVERLKKDFDLVYGSLKIFSDSIPLKDRKEIEKQNEDIEGKISDLQKGLEEDRNILKKRQLIERDLEEYERVLDFNETLLESAYHAVITCDIHGILFKIRNEGSAVKEAVQNCWNAIEDIKSNLNDKAKYELEGRVNSLNEAVTRLEEKMTHAKEVLCKDLTQLKELEVAFALTNSIKLEWDEIEKSNDCDLESLINQMKEVTKRAELTHRDVLKFSKNVEEIAFSSIQRDAGTILKTIDENEDRIKEILVTAEGKIEFMEKVKKQLAELNEDIDMINERAAGNEILHPVIENVAGLNDHVERCELLIEMNENLSEEYSKLEARSEKLKSKLTRRDVEGLETKLNRARNGICEVRLKLKDEVKMCNGKISLVGILDDISSEVANLKGLARQGGGKSFDELSKLLANIRVIEDAKEKIGALDNELNGLKKWGKEFADKMKFELNEVKREIDLKDADLKASMEKKLNLMEERTADLKSKVDVYESEKIEWTGCMEERQEFTWDLSKMIDEVTSLREAAVLLRESEIEAGLVNLSDTLSVLDVVNEKLNDIMDSRNVALEKWEESQAAVKSYEEDLSTLSCQLEEIREAEGEYSRQYSIADLKEAIKENEFLLNKINEALLLIFEDEHDFMNNLCEGKRADMLEIKSEFLEDFNHLRGQVRKDFEKVEQMEKNLGITLNKIDELVERIAWVNDECSKNCVLTDGGEHKTYFQGQLTYLKLLKDEIRQVESENDKALVYLPEKERSDLYEAFYNLSLLFDEVLESVNDEVAFSETIERVLQEVNELKNLQKSSDYEKSITDLLDFKDRVMRKLDGLEEELRNCHQKDVSLERSRDPESLVSKQYEKAMLEIRDRKKVVHERKKSLEFLEGELNGMEKILAERDEELVNVQFELDQIKSKGKLDQRDCENLEELQRGLDETENELREIALKAKENSAKANNFGCIHEKVKTALEKMRSSRNFSVEIAKGSNEAKERIRTCVEEAKRYGDVVAKKLDGMDLFSLKSFEEGYEIVNDFKEYLTAISCEYSELKKEAQTIEEEYDDCKQVDESLRQFEQQIVAGEDFVTSRNRKLTALEKIFNEWKGEQDLLNEKIAENEVEINLYENLKHAEFAVMEEVEGLDGMESLLNGNQEVFEWMMKELPANEKMNVNKMKNRVEMKILQRKKELDDKIRMINELKKELWEIEKHLNVNLKWILIAKEAVTKENKTVQCIEDLLKDRDCLVGQISSLNDDVDAIVTIGNSLCIKLPNSEKLSLRKLLEDVKREWESVKVELSEKKEKLDESIVERDAFMTSVVSCLMRLEDVEDHCDEFKCLDEKSKDEKLEKIRGELNALTIEKESLSHDSKSILKKLVEDEKEKIVNDLEMIKNKIEISKNWMKDREDEMKSRFEEGNEIARQIQNMEAEIDEAGKLIHRLEGLKDNAESAGTKILQAVKHVEFATKVLMKLQQEVEMNGSLHLSEKLSETEMQLSSTKCSLDGWQLKLAGISKRSEKLKNDLQECWMKTKFVERCLEYGDLTDIENNLKEVREGVNDVKTLLNEGEIFEKQTVELELENLQRKIELVEESLKDRSQQIKVQEQSKFEDFLLVLKDFEERFQNIKKQMQEECQGTEATEGKLKSSEESLDLLKTLKLDVSLELPKVFLLIKDDSGVNSFEKECLELQESIFELKATIEFRIETLKDLISKIQGFCDEMLKTDIETSAISNALQRCTSEGSNLEVLEKELGILNERCPAVEYAYVSMLSSAEHLPENLCQREKEKLILDLRDRIDLVKSLPSKSEKKTKIIAKIKRLIEYKDQVEGVDVLREMLDQFITDIQCRYDTTQVMSFAQKLREKHDILVEVENSLSGIELECFSKRFQDGVSELVNEVAVQKIEITNEISRFEEWNLKYFDMNVEKNGLAEKLCYDDVEAKIERPMVLAKDGESLGYVYPDVKVVQEIKCEEIIMENDCSSKGQTDFYDENGTIVDVDQDEENDRPKDVTKNEWTGEEENEGLLGGRAMEPCVQPKDSRLENQLSNEQELEMNVPATDSTSTSIDEHLACYQSADKSVKESENEALVCSKEKIYADAGKVNGAKESCEIKRAVNDINYSVLTSQEPENSGATPIHDNLYTSFHNNFEDGKMHSILQKVENGSRDEKIAKTKEGHFEDGTVIQSPPKIDSDGNGSEENIAEVGFSSDTSSLDNEAVIRDEHTLGRRSDQSTESGLASLLPVDDAADVANFLSESLSSLETGFEDEEEIFSLMRDASNELCHVDQLLASSTDHDFESIESLQKSLKTLQVRAILNIVWIC